MSISILDRLWFLHQNPGQQAPQILIDTPLSIEEGQNLQIQLSAMIFSTKKQMSDYEWNPTDEGVPTPFGTDLQNPRRKAPHL